MNHKIVVEEKHHSVQEQILLDNGNNYVFATETQTGSLETESNSKRVVNLSVQMTVVLIVFTVMEF